MSKCYSINLLVNWFQNTHDTHFLLLNKYTDKEELLSSVKEDLSYLIR